MLGDDVVGEEEGFNESGGGGKRGQQNVGRWRTRRRQSRWGQRGWQRAGTWRGPSWRVSPPTSQSRPILSASQLCYGTAGGGVAVRGQWPTCCGPHKRGGSEGGGGCGGDEEGTEKE